MDQDTTSSTRRSSRRQPRQKRRKLVTQPGQRIGRGVVVDPLVLVEEPNGGVCRSARLLCDCGNEYVRPIRRLVGAGEPSLSCGCLARERRIANIAKGNLKGRPHNFIDLAGRTVGMLTVIRLAERKNGTRWLCRCDCGNEAIVSGGELRREKTRSCGCQWRVPRLPPAMVARRKLLKGYIGTAAIRGLSWELSEEDFDRLTTQDCVYCGSPPALPKPYATRKASGAYLYNGIDRVDNDLGYTPGNVVSCCRTCNRAKSNLPLDVFMAWVGRLTAYQMFSSESLPSQLLKKAS